MAERREQRNATTKAWKLRNPEKYREHCAFYNARFRESNPNYHALWRENNRDKTRGAVHRYRARKMGAVGSHSESEWQAIVRKQRGKCARCGVKPQVLERDHIVPLFLGGSNMAVNIQGLCRKCNAGKRDRLQADTQFSLFDRRMSLGG